MIKKGVVFYLVVVLICGVSTFSASAQTVTTAIYPSVATYVYASSAATNYSSETTFLAGRSRFGYAKFDISSLKGKAIISAVLKGAKKDANSNQMGIFYVPNDSAVTNSLTYNTKPSVPAIRKVTGEESATNIPIDLNSMVANMDIRGSANTTFSTDITTQVYNENLINGDNELSLCFYPINVGVTGGSSIYANEIYKQNAANSEEQWLRLEVATTDDPDQILTIDDSKAIVIKDNNNNAADLAAVTSNLVLPTVGVSGQTQIFWTSGNNEVIDNNGNVTRPLYTAGDQTVQLTANVIKGSATYLRIFNVTVLKQDITDEARVDLDIEKYVKIYNNTAAVSNLNFQKTGQYGSTISWSSNMPQYLSNEGVVVRPGEQESNLNVTVSVVVTYGSVSKNYEITIYVPKLESKNIASMMDSIENVHDYAIKYVDNTAAGTAPGQFDPILKTNAIQDIESYYTKINNQSTYSDISSAIDNIKSILKDYIATAVQSSKVVDTENNAIEFSSYRIQLMQSVVEGQINLLTEPDMYTESAKYALQEYIDYSVSVLDGTYKRPFTRNRSFLKPREDEAIQFALKRYSKTYQGLPSDGTVMGIDAMNKWFLNQHMLNGTTQLFLLSPTDDTYIQAADTNYGTADTIIAGNNRIGFAKFDLSSIGGEIKKAYLKMWNTTTNNPRMVICNIPDEINDLWTEKNLTANSWLALNNTTDTHLLLNSTLIRDFYPGGQNAGCSVDVTNTAREQLSTTKKLGLCFWVEPNTANPPSFYSKDNITSNAANRKITLSVETDITDKNRFNAKYNDIISKANDMLASAKVGTDVGNYPKEAYDKFVAAKADAVTMNASGDSVLTAKELVKLFNAMREMRYTQVLRSDVEPFSNAYFTEEDAVNFANKVNRFAVLKDQYNYLKQVSDQMDMTMIDKLFWIMNEDHPREEINQYFKLYSGTPNYNFTPPAKTAYGKIEILLPGVENENQGDTSKIGHVWIDTVSIAVSGYDNLTIDNAGFDEGTNVPDNWEYVTYSGNPKLTWETRPNYVDAGGHSIYIENPTENDSGGIRYNGKLDLYPSVAHTLTFKYKMDAKMNQGIKFVITYYDASDNVIGNYTNVSNKKSGLGNQLMSAQADAIVYTVEKDPYYAEKAKKRLLFSINDFNQGAEYWMNKNARPDDIDAYGEVQGGRIMQTICATYTLIKDAGVFTPEEYARFMDGCEYLAKFLLDLRDRTEGNLGEALVGGNWLTDQACGAGMYGITFSKEQDSRMFLTNGALVLNGQLNLTVYEDGAWPESIRYVGSVINKFGPFARAINIARGDNWWETTKLPRMFDYLISSSTPPYVFFNNKISEPPFGDNSLKEGSDVFAIMGNYYDQVGQADMKLSEWMYKTWVLAGYPMSVYGNENIALQNFFNPIQVNIKTNNPLKLGDYQTSNTGLYIFRENYGRDNAKYFSIMSNDTALGHGHYDQGSFMLFANSVPLVMDPGVESYFDSTRGWYQNTHSHAALLFTKDGTNPLSGPTTSKRDNIFKSDEMDYIRVTTTWSSASSAVDKRNIALLENGFNAVVIWDQISGASQNSIFNLPVVAKDAQINGNIVTSTGFYNTDLRTTILEPKTPQIETMWKDSTAVGPTVGGSNNMNYIRSTAAKNANHLVVLEPLKTNQKPLVIQSLNSNDSNITAYRLQKVDGTYAVVLTNNAVSARSITIDSSKNLIDMQTGEKYTSTDGKVSIPAAASKIMVLKSEDILEPVKTSIEISGPVSIQIPSYGKNVGVYSADVIGQYNNTILSEKVKWSIKENVAGVSVDSDSGIVNVDSAATNNTTFTLAASDGDITSSQRIRLVSADIQRSSLTITGPDVVAVPSGENSASVLYTAQVLDQFGAPVTDNIEWSLYQEIDGVYISKGILYVSGSVPVGTSITIIAKSSSSTSALSSKTVEVMPQMSSDIQLVGKTYISIPSSGNRTFDYSAKIVDQNGNEYGSQQATFSLVTNDSNITLSNASITINSSVSPDTEIKLQITSKENPALTKAFSIYTAANLPESITLSGQSSVSAPASGYSTYVYSVIVKDYNGKAMTAGVTYTLSKPVPGVAIDSEKGVLTVYSTAVADSFNIVAKVLGFEDEISGSAAVSLTSDVKLSQNSGGGGNNVPSGMSSPVIPGNPPANQAETSDFRDVPKDYWAYNYIGELKKNGIVSGDENKNFNPENNISRAEFIQMLVKTLSLEAGGEIKFSDVNADNWYYKSVAIVGALGLVSGYEDGTFRPDNPITREEMVLILYRAVELRGISGKDNQEIEFGDKNQISDYAKTSVEKISSLGLVGGFPDNSFRPQDNATRAQTATIVFRLLNLLKGSA